MLFCAHDRPKRKSDDPCGDQLAGAGRPRGHSLPAEDPRKKRQAPARSKADAWRFCVGIPYIYSIFLKYIPLLRRWILLFRQYFPKKKAMEADTRLFTQCFQKKILLPAGNAEQGQVYDLLGGLQHRVGVLDGRVPLVLHGRRPEIGVQTFQILQRL